MSVVAPWSVIALIQSLQLQTQTVYTSTYILRKTLMTISEAFKAYAQDVIAFRGQSPKTEETHNVCKKALLKFYGDIDIEYLSFNMVRDWKLDMDKRLSISTCREYIIRLRVVLFYLKLRGENVLDPQRIPVPKRPDKVPDFIYEEDVCLLIEAVLKPRRGYPIINMYKNAAIIALLYASGVRVSELVALNRSDIRKDGTFTVVGKGKKARLCFTDERCLELLNKYLDLRCDTNPALFVHKDTGRRLTSKVVQLIFRNASSKTKLKMAVSPHTLRHSFATNLLRNNANIRYVQALLGHSSLETTQMYTHVVDRDLHEVYKKHHTV